MLWGTRGHWGGADPGRPVGHRALWGTACLCTHMRCVCANMYVHAQCVARFCICGPCVHMCMRGQRVGQAIHVRAWTYMCTVHTYVQCIRVHTSALCAACAYAPMWCVYVTHRCAACAHMRACECTVLVHARCVYIPMHVQMCTVQCVHIRASCVPTCTCVQCLCICMCTYSMFMYCV